MKYLILFILYLINNCIPLYQCNTYTEHPRHSFYDYDHSLYNNKEKSLDEDDYNKSLNSNIKLKTLRQHGGQNYALPFNNSQYNSIHNIHSQLTPTTTIKPIQRTSMYLPKQNDRYFNLDSVYLQEHPEKQLASHYIQNHYYHGSPQTVLEPPRHGHRSMDDKMSLNGRPFERLELLPSTVNESKPVFDFEDQMPRNLENSTKFQNDDDISTPISDSSLPLDEALNEKEQYLNEENEQTHTTQGPQRSVRTKTIQIAQPALKAKTFEIHLPAIQKEFYDIEERFIIKPAGAIVLELDNPIAKIPKGETILPLGQPHPAVANAYQQNGKSNVFSNIIYSSTGGSHDRHRLALPKKGDDNRKDSTEQDDDLDDQNGITFRKGDLKVHPSQSQSNKNSNFEVEYLDGTFTTNIQPRHNYSNQFGQYREAPRSHYSTFPKTYQQSSEDSNINDESRRFYFSPSASIPTTQHVDVEHIHNVPKEKQDDLNVAFYSKPYANIRLYTNHEVNVNNSQHIQDKEIPFKVNDRNLNAVYNLTQNFDRTPSSQFTKNENNFQSHIPLKNILIHADLILNNRTLNHSQHKYHDYGDDHLTLQQNDTLPLKNVIIYANSNGTLKYNQHEHDEVERLNPYIGEQNKFVHTDNNGVPATDYNIEQSSTVIQYPYHIQSNQHSGNGQKFMRLIERPKNSNNNFRKLENYVNEFNADGDTEKFDISPTFLRSANAVPGSRVIASTPASRDPSLINESVQTRRIVINHPFHTVREIVEHEPYTNYHEIEIEEPDFPEIFKTGHYILPNGTQFN